MELIIQIICSFIATIGLAVNFNAPRKSLIPCGIVGIIGWVIYYILTQNQFDSVPASFSASFVVALVAHIFARHYKMPMLIYSVAGIIPLVPGGMAYETIRAIIENNYIVSLQYGARTGILTGAIVMGLVFAEVFVRFFYTTKEIVTVSKEKQ